jgi:DNA gyrase subunit A
VLLATRKGKAIRFESTDVREFQSRTSTGVRGVTFEGRRRGDLAVDPQGFGATTEERDAYLRAAPWKENDTRADAERRAHGRVEAPRSSS